MFDANNKVIFSKTLNFDDLSKEIQEELLGKGNIIKEETWTWQGYLKEIEFRNYINDLLKDFDISSFTKWKKSLNILDNSLYYPYVNTYREVKDGQIVTLSIMEKKNRVGKLFNESDPNNPLYYPRSNPYDLFNAKSDDAENAYKYRLVANLINKYHLLHSQILILLLNVDLLNLIYIKENIPLLYGNKASLLDNNIDGMMANLQFLIDDQIFDYVTLNGLENLMNSFLFYNDIKEVLNKYPNVTNKDVVILASRKIVSSFDELKNILPVINNLEENEKGYLYQGCSNIFTEVSIFPNLNSYDPLNEGIDIVNKNPYFFNEYKDFFERELNITYLNKIKNHQNFKEILKVFALFKEALNNMYPSYQDNLKYYPVYEDVRYESTRSGNCYDPCEIEYETQFSHNEVTGSIIKGEDIIKAQKELFKRIKKESLNEDFNFDKLFMNFIHDNNDKNIYLMMMGMLKKYMEKENNISLKKRLT